MATGSDTHYRHLLGWLGALIGVVATLCAAIAGAPALMTHEPSAPGGAGDDDARRQPPAPDRSLLRKLRESGYASLTADEKQRLLLR